METKYYTLNDKEELLKHFLIVPRDFEKFINTKQRVIWIYKIIRISDEKSYIGRTTDIRRRAFNYINEYLKGDGNRKINKVINDDGNDSCGYKYENPDKFMEYCSKVSNSIV